MIVQCGIPRSGSTLVFQVLRALFPDQQVIKVHPLMEECRQEAILTIRNPMDVVASLLRISDKPLWENLGVTMDYALRNYEALTAWSGPLLRYEKFFRNSDVLFESIGRHFHIIVPLEKRKELMERYGLEANRKRAEKLADFSQVDEDFIHGKHIGTGRIGSWEKVIPTQYHKKVEQTMMPALQQWGYR